MSKGFPMLPQAAQAIRRLPGGRTRGLDRGGLCAGCFVGPHAHGL